MTAPGRGSRTAAAWYALTAVIGIAAMVTQFVTVMHNGNALGANGEVSTRAIRFFSYFTIQSNILVAATSVTLALNPVRDGRVWRVVRLWSLFGITVTFVTYAVVLAPLTSHTGLARLTDVSVHYVVPIMTILGWLLFGPRPRIDEQTLIWSLTWPAAYIVYTLAHGAASDWYPYPFIDAAKIGYATTVRNGLGMIVLMVGVGALYMFLDHRLSAMSRRERIA